ncbi:MAG: ATP-binding cassette domain-containing protein, partial [Desulfobacterales bacterium]|nr:ATP-binding cassette domain-containing protein [Desulfobacterales bacterium]
QLLDEYQRLSKQLEKNKNIGLLQDMDRIQHKLEVEGGWQIYQQVDAVISRLNLDPEALFESLSAGLKRRVLLARALVGNPDVLLLDEPTNHLDVNTISWMEDFLLKNKGSLLFVTHDRLFLQRLATRIIEIDRGSLTSWDCDYKTYLKRKQETLDAESEYRFQFKKKLAQEEVWLRKGVKARRTRNEGRVQALLKMREEKRDWRRRVGTARMQVYEAERTGKLVVEAKKITYSYDGKKYINDFSATIIRGDRIGIIGPNGSGKSTLLGLLLGEKPLQEGLIRLGTRLETAYFDQLREQLNEEMTVQDNVADGKEMLSINGKPRHVIGYLKDFLFTPDRVRSPVKTLSGGERNRLLLAKLFTRPSNVLVLDEPTNDLDIETLELLEERLLEYTGTVLLVSHDREFLNNVVTSTFVFQDNGKIIEYAGGYDDWLSQRQSVKPEDISTKKVKNIKKPSKNDSTKSRVSRKTSRKIGYMEKRELDALPELIEKLEEEQALIYKTMADQSFYQQGGDEINRVKGRLEALENDLSKAYERWEVLEKLQ